MSRSYEDLRNFPQEGISGLITKYVNKVDDIEKSLIEDFKIHSEIDDNIKGNFCQAFGVLKPSHGQAVKIIAHNVFGISLDIVKSETFTIDTLEGIQKLLQQNKDMSLQDASKELDGLNYNQIFRLTRDNVLVSDYPIGGLPLSDKLSFEELMKLMRARGTPELENEESPRAFSSIAHNQRTQQSLPPTSSYAATYTEEKTAELVSLSQRLSPEELNKLMSFRGTPVLENEESPSAFSSIAQNQRTQQSLSPTSSYAAAYTEEKNDKAVIKK